MYLIEAIDEYAVSSLPEYEGKKFVNVAKEGLTLGQNKEKLEEMKTEYEPLTKWLQETALKDKVWAAPIYERLCRVLLTQVWK